MTTYRRVAQFLPNFYGFLRKSQVWRVTWLKMSYKCCFFSDVIVRGESYALLWVVTPLTLSTQVLSFMLGGLWL
nr:MAG TPA: hypothetical protein [Caudoviricetes sp.]